MGEPSTNVSPTQFSQLPHISPERYTRRREAIHPMLLLPNKQQQQQQRAILPPIHPS